LEKNRVFAFLLRTRANHGGRIGLVGVAAAAALLSGCLGGGGRGGPVAYDVKDFSAPDVETVAPPVSQQRIGPMDKIRVTVFQVADLSGEFTVDASGNIDYPLLGTVAAQGMTPPELSERIAKQLGQRYLRNPSVQTSFLEQQQQTITLDGSVRQPGVVPIQGQTTLLRAIAMGRGTAEDANPSRVVVFRTIQGKRMAAAFDLKAIRQGAAEDPIIYGNDIVVVDGSRARQTFRDVLSALPILGVFTLFQ
jgi:polysaccharide export outer membrane protein